MAKKDQVPVFKENKPGRRIRSVSPYISMTSYIMKQRCDALNYFADTVEISKAERFLRQKREEGLKGLGFLHLFVASYVRTISQHPELNRFICGQRPYAAKDIMVVMVVKKSMDGKSDDTTIKINFKPTDTITDVYNKMNEVINSVKEGNATAMDDMAGTLMSFPRFLLKFFMRVINWVDYHNMLPGVFYNASPFHGSMFITDMGSLGISPIYHHIYNFGSIPIFIAFGTKRHAYEMNRAGEVEMKRYIDFKVVTDERITDGYSYAQGFKTLRNCLANPEILDKPPEKVVEDIY